MAPALLLAAALAAPLSAAEPAPSGRIERIRALSQRWESGGLSHEEKDELLRALTRQVLGEGDAAPAQPGPAPVAAGSGHKVIAVYVDRNTTKLVIEARRPLVAGAPVYAGPREVEATLQSLLSRSGDLYYYAASTPGEPKVGEGDAVVTRRTLATPSPLRLRVAETYTFEQKRVGEVTAVQEGRAMIDRGTLHEVRERDIYRVFDASGARKGFLEIHGIGDLQSSGVLYNRFEDRDKRALTTEPGDRVVFMGQRKLFAIGGMFGLATGGPEEFGSGESASGAGVVWNLMFKNGWGFEAVIGSYERRMSGSQYIRPTTNQLFGQELSWKASYLFPVAVKKNFFYPSAASPFLLAGGAYFRGNLVKKEYVYDGGAIDDLFTYDNPTETISPMLGGGVEFFPTRLIRPRFDVRWFYGPTVRTRDKFVRGDKLYLSFSLFSAW